MKKAFKKEHRMLFDETINMGFARTVFTGRKKLSKSQKEKCLADLGSGSETEYQSATILIENTDKSPRFLDWLIECCEKENIYLNSYFCWAFIFFTDKKDERILPAILKSFSKCPDEDLGNYPQILGIYGGKEAKAALKERFHKIKDNPQTFAKQKDWNDLGFSLLHICQYLLQFEPDNVEAADCLAKLAKHPNSFNKDSALNAIVEFLTNTPILKTHKIVDIFVNSLENVLKTKNPRLFGILLPYLLQVKPEQTYEKLKKLYLKTKKEERFNHLLLKLFYSVERNLYWIGKLTNDLPETEIEPLKEYLTNNLVKPINKTELVSEVAKLLDSESPNTRIFAINQLKRLNNEDAQKILEKALIDEPDEFIRKQFQKKLKELKRLCK